MISRFSASILWILWLALCSISADPHTDDRETWQRPGEVMDALEARPGSTVADVGAGDANLCYGLVLNSYVA